MFLPRTKCDALSILLTWLCTFFSDFFLSQWFIFITFFSFPLLCIYCLSSFVLRVICNRLYLNHWKHTYVNDKLVSTLFLLLVFSFLGVVSNRGDNWHQCKQLNNNSSFSSFFCVLPVYYKVFLFSGSPYYIFVYPITFFAT